MTRLFVALDVPPAVRRPLDAAVEPLRGQHRDLAWTPAVNWHLTLAFLGHVDVPPDQVLAVLSPVAAGCGPIGLALAPAGRFGQRVLWMGVDDRPQGTVTRLGGAAQEALTEAAIPVDDRPVHPHLTLARARGRGRSGSRVRQQLVDAVPQVAASWSADELLLMRSVPTGRRQPNRYDPVGRLPLGAG